MAWARFTNHLASARASAPTHTRSASGALLNSRTARVDRMRPQALFQAGGRSPSAITSTIE